MMPPIDARWTNQEIGKAIADAAQMCIDIGKAQERVVAQLVLVLRKCAEKVDEQTELVLAETEHIRAEIAKRLHE